MTILTDKTKQELIQTAKALTASGKGILAADESTTTIQKRFDAIGVESSQESRQAYREMLFTAPGMEQFISGVIMFDETIRQKTSDGALFSKHLASKGVLTGIKVDAGAKPLALSDEREKITEGLDGLRERLAQYKSLGASFAKWRAVIMIGDTIPSKQAINTNAHALARYAALCQEAGIVPIIEPEVLMDGSHTIQKCEEVTTKVLKEVFEELEEQNVFLQGIILKPNMVIAGSECEKQSTSEEVAEASLRCFNKTVPSDVPGIAFLSGGQSDEEATKNLKAINTQKADAPWVLTFSYGRALQQATQKAWAGKNEEVAKAQEVFLKHAKENSEATRG